MTCEAVVQWPYAGYPRGRVGHAPTSSANHLMASPAMTRSGYTRNIRHSPIPRSSFPVKLCLFPVSAEKQEKEPEHVTLSPAVAVQDTSTSRRLSRNGNTPCGNEPPTHPRGKL